MKTLRSTVIIVLLMLIMTALKCIPAYSLDSDLEFNKLVQQKFDAWVKARNAWIEANPGSCGAPEIKEETKDLLAIGSKIIPFFITMYEEQLKKKTWDNRFQADMFVLVLTITHKRFAKSDYPSKEANYRMAEMQLYVNWWKTGRIQTPAKFASIFSQWDSLDKAGDKKEADKVIGKIAQMGVEILPMVMQKIEDGDERMVPWVKRIMQTRVEWKTADLSTVLEWWEQNKENLTFPPVVVEKPAGETITEPTK